MDEQAMTVTPTDWHKDESSNQLRRWNVCWSGRENDDDDYGKSFIYDKQALNPSAKFLSSKC